MVGAALVRRLMREDCQVITAPRGLDLREQAEVREWFASNRPEVVLVAAAKVGATLTGQMSRQGKDWVLEDVKFEPAK